MGVDATVIGEEYQVLHTIIHQGRVDKTFLGGVTKHKVKYVHTSLDVAQEFPSIDLLRYNSQS